ncbi:MAG: sulfatase-like hydrolase/transferase [Planctomycetaceae bacterium]|nr:sulfatase-like hydrolase/transferase [Planctomycetaceae bacterium]
MTRPNILWYCTDQQRFDTIGALGNAYVQTPVVDSLVAEGVAFTQAYCQSPICTPSRASFMSGLYPSRLHNTRNGNDTFPDWPPLISRLIADSGYLCGLIGKFHLVSAGHRAEPRLDDGFTLWQHSHAPRDDWPEGTHDYADWVRAQGKSLDDMRNSKERVDPEFHQTKWASERAIEFIEQDHQQPWLLNINIYDPHPPFIPPEKYANLFDPAAMPGPHFEESDKATQELLSQVDFQPVTMSTETSELKKVQALYYAMITQIDDQFARILNALESTGQRDNTVIIFTSDHGEMLGDHGLVQKGCRFYEGLVRVPLIFSWPGHFVSNQRATGLVELLDLSATLLDLAGIPIPDYHQGQSLLPVLKGEQAGAQIRDSVRCEYFDALDPFFTGGEGSFATMYRDDRYKLSVYHDKDLGELYDLQTDPWEHNNLWDDPEHQAVKHRLILASFNSHVVLTTDVGSKRIAPM